MTEHKDAADPDIHEPKDVGVALVDQVYVADGAGSGAWKKAASGETLFQQTADKVVANTVTETTLFGAGVGTLVLPASENKIGKSFRVRVQGIVSDTATPTLNIIVKLGGVTLSLTGASTLGAVANSHWAIDFLITIRSVGTTGTVMAAGSFVTEVGDHFGLTITTPVTIDTTVDQTLDVTATWGTAAAGNTITSQLACIEVD